MGVAKKRVSKARSVSKSRDVADAEAFLEGIESLTDSIDSLIESVEENTKAIESLKGSVKELDSHNAILYQAIDRLSGRLDVINGVGSLVGRLLPGR